MISVKIELTIGETVHHLTMDELRELRKVIDGLVSAPVKAADEKEWLKKYDELKKSLGNIDRNPPPYNPHQLYGPSPFKPYWSGGAGDVIPDPWKVIC